MDEIFFDTYMMCDNCDKIVYLNSELIVGSEDVDFGIFLSVKRFLLSNGVVVFFSTTSSFIFDVFCGVDCEVANSLVG